VIKKKRERIAKHILLPIVELRLLILTNHPFICKLLTEMSLTGDKRSFIVALSSFENNPMKIAYKVWLDNHGKAFGDGPYELLRRVEKTKSLHRAAQQMGMAYSKAWRLILTMEQRLKVLCLNGKLGATREGDPGSPHRGRTS